MILCLKYSRPGHIKEIGGLETNKCKLLLKLMLRPRKVLSLTILELWYRDFLNYT